MTSEYLRILKNITPNLPSFGDISNNKSSSYRQISVERGHAYIVGLSDSDDYSVTFNYAAADTPFPIHHHKQIEIFVIISGTMELTIDEKETVKIERGESYKLLPDVKHRAYFPTNTRYLAITIPEEPNFPRRK